VALTEEHLITYNRKTNCMTHSPVHRSLEIIPHSKDPVLEHFKWFESLCCLAQTHLGFMPQLKRNSLSFPRQLHVYLSGLAKPTAVGAARI